MITPFRVYYREYGQTCTPLESRVCILYLKRYFATGIAGLSVVADSLSAIKYAKVKPIRDEEGITVDFEIEGEFPKYGNDDDRVDEIAVEIVKTFLRKLQKYDDSIDTFEYFFS